MEKDLLINNLRIKLRKHFNLFVQVSENKSVLLYDFSNIRHFWTKIKRRKLFYKQKNHFEEEYDKKYRME